MSGAVVRSLEPGDTKIPGTWVSQRDLELIQGIYRAVPATGQQGASLVSTKGLRERGLARPNRATLLALSNLWASGSPTRLSLR